MVNSRGLLQNGMVRIVISKALIGSLKQLSYVEEGKHKRKLRFALFSLTQQAQEHHTGRGKQGSPRRFSQ
ncbi:hypothetical protein Tco_1305940 [Tanacetum coccineum]